MKEKVFVLAFSMNSFARFKSQCNCDNYDLVYVSYIDKIKGCRDTKFIVLEGAYMHPNYNKFMEELQLRNGIDITKEVIR